MKSSDAGGNADAKHTTIVPCVVTFLVILAAIPILRLEGRVWRCQLGDWAIWSGDVWSAHNSQHPFDPYAVTHALHGLLFFELFVWLLPRVSRAWRFALSMSIETLWELVENSNFVVDRYRETTMAVGYRGDSIINSLGDLAACAFGLWLAPRIGLWWSIALFVVAEVALLIWIRDNLFLNVLMLVWPIEAVKTWQMGT